MTPGRGSRPCPWCGGDDTARIGDAGSLLMTEQWFCDGCSSAFEVIRRRGTGMPRGTGPIVTTGRAGPPGSSGEESTAP